MAERPFVSRVINKLAHYEGGIVPNVEQAGQESPAADEPPPVDSPEVVAGGKKKKKKKKAAPKKASQSFTIHTHLVYGHRSSLGPTLTEE